MRPSEVKEHMSQETVSLGGDWAGNILVNAQAKLEERLRKCGLLFFPQIAREFAKSSAI